jgi:type I restriction enzyme S subunit
LQVQIKEPLKIEFYKHEKFGDVPIGWDVVRLGGYFDFFPTASYSRSLLTETGECLYIHYGDLHTKFERFIDADKDVLPFISKEMARKYTPVAEGDLIISDASEDYEGVGKAVEVINVGKKIIISGLHTLHLRAKNNEFINGFKGYILNEARVRNGILRSATGIKVYSVSKTELKKIFLPKPPVKEQKAIATILSKVDEAIKATENSIRVAEKLKKSLMQNLLTGKLKPDGTWRKKDEFSMTKIGLLPKDWQVKSVKELSIQVTDGEHTTPERSDTGYYLLSARNIKNSYLDLSDVDYVPEKELLRIQKRCNPQPGDILISCSGTIGNVCIVPEGFVGGMVRSAALIKLKKDEIESDFAELVFQSYSLQNQMKISVASSVQGNIFQGAIKKLRISYPPNKNERDQITSTLKNVSLVGIEKQIKIQRLKRLKKALMQSLLTGKVRLDLEKIETVITNEAI